LFSPQKSPSTHPEKKNRFRHFIGVYRWVYRTTWKFRLTLILTVFLLAWVTRGLWGPAIGQSLVCGGDLKKSQAIVIANFDVDYLLFKWAGALERRGFGDRVIIPVKYSKRDESKPNEADKAVAEALCGVADIKAPLFLPVIEKEPISYHVARQVGEKLEKDRIRSVIIVSSALRSKRDFLIFKKVLAEKGITVTCAPVLGEKTPANWMNSWHGVQDVFLQTGKLWYYRLKLLMPKQYNPIRFLTGVF